MNISELINKINMITNRNQAGSQEFFDDIIHIVEAINNLIDELKELNIDVEKVNELNKILYDIVESMENKDYILTQDLLEYELSDCIKVLE